ncbi:MAG TPA: LysR substrate-binding domain-containing protein, partial [Phenylobacterium sp.]|nr:LysR substrate-binding domain-containing protein [Phenylobacterium sp.]
RSTRRVALTEVGQAFLERVRPLLDDLRAAEGEASARALGEPQGRLRIALPSAFGRLWIAPALSGFLALHPRVAVEAQFSNAYVDLVGEGFDLAVRLGSLPDSRLVARKVAERHRLLCAAPSYLATYGTPRAPADLARHSCLRFTGKPNPHVWEFVGQAGEMQVVPISGPFASDDAEALVQAGVAGAGVVYATDWLVGRELADGRLVPLLEDWRMPNEGGVYVVTPSRTGLPSKTRAFSDWIAARLSLCPWRTPA